MVSSGMMDFLGIEKMCIWNNNDSLVQKFRRLNNWVIFLCVDFTICKLFSWMYNFKIDKQGFRFGQPSQA
jgi:hypothetical protein